MAFDRALTVSDGMVRSMVSIGRLVGRDEAAGLAEPDPAARRRARARAVHASLALGGGTLSEGQVAALAWGRAVAGPDPDALGGENVCRAYAALLGLAPHSAEDLLWAHGTITGRPVVETPEGVSDLLSWVGHTTAHPLVAACVAHCEILCTLPFAEGDGALARLWQAAVLCRWSGVFTYLPVESEVWGREEGYRRALGVAGATGDAVPFVAFMLDAIGASLSRAVAGRDPAPLDREGPRALQGRLLALFRDRPDLSLAQAARALGATVRQVERCASRLKAEGRLRRVGPRHGGALGDPPLGAVAHRGCRSFRTTRRHATRSQAHHPKGDPMDDIETGGRRPWARRCRALLLKAVDASLMAWARRRPVPLQCLMAATILVIIPAIFLLFFSFLMDPITAIYGDSAVLDSLALTALVGHGTGLALAWIDWRARAMDGPLPDPGGGSGGPPRDRPLGGPRGPRGLGHPVLERARREGTRRTREIRRDPHGDPTDRF